MASSFTDSDSNDSIPVSELAGFMGSDRNDGEAMGRSEGNNAGRQMLKVKMPWE